MRIRAFHGLRYNGTARSAGALAAPPYDQIDSRRRDELHATPHHFAHLTRPVAAAGAEAHRHSADLHAAWLAGGITCRDPRPALYANAIELPSGEVRLGLAALIDLEPAGSGVIRPHEETVDKTVAERLGLLRTTGVDYEPILVLADDGGALDELLEEDCAGEAVAEHDDDLGNRHRLFPVSDPARIERYRDALNAAYGLIADGHHRYKTASLLAGEVGAARGTAAAAKLGVITSLASKALAIDPIHRAVRRSLDVAEVVDMLTDRQPWQGDSGAALAAAVAAAAQPALAVLTAGGAEIWRLDPAQGPSDLPSAASDLAVVMLHRSLFPRWSIPAAAATDGTVGYRSVAEPLFRQVASGEVTSGIFLPPMTAAGFAAAIADGDVLPPKSTRFLPKVVSGLVWAAHADPVA
jgi:uncharacterized protein (DUF1015 family)